MMATQDAPAIAPGAETKPLYCLRCDNPRPLGLVSPGRYWTRTNGRTVLVQGGIVQVWCEKCGKEHELRLTA